MKLTIKTLQKAQFKIDIEDDKTVRELKEKIETDHGKDYPSGAQKLIYSGKILADECKLSEYNIDEKKFVVLMITRPPPTPKVQPTAEQSTTTTSAASPSTPVKKEDAKPKTEQPKTTTTQSTTSSNPATNTTATTTNLTTTATSLQQSQQPANRPLPGLDRSSTNPLDSSGQPLMASRVASMMNQPHFRQIQDLIQQSPHLLSSTIEALAGTDPEMYNFISDNPDIFVNALNHPPMAGSRNPPSSRGSTTGGGQQQSSERSSQDVRTSSGGRQQPVVDQILPNVSQHDKEAIERLKELGFSEYQAVQAYIACDKDEQLAANLLFQMEQ